MDLTIPPAPLKFDWRKKSFFIQFLGMSTSPRISLSSARYINLSIREGMKIVWDVLFMFFNLLQPGTLFEASGEDLRINKSQYNKMDLCTK